MYNNIKQKSKEMRGEILPYNVKISWSMEYVINLSVIMVSEDFVKKHLTC